jgi:predicted secreted protein
VLGRGTGASLASVIRSLAFPASSPRNWVRLRGVAAEEKTKGLCLARGINGAPSSGEWKMAVVRRSAWLSFGLVVSILMVDCVLKKSHASQATHLNMTNMTVSEKDNGGTFELRTGEILTVRLESIPGTGYSWYIEKNDNKLMELMGEHTHEVPKGTTVVGGMEYEVFRLRALASGTNGLKLSYKRIWEKGKKPLKTLLIRVRVKP